MPWALIHIHRNVHRKPQITQIPAWESNLGPPHTVRNGNRSATKTVGYIIFNVVVGAFVLAKILPYALELKILPFAAYT